MIIYKAVCRENQKVYIGKTIKSLESRKANHKWYAAHGYQTKFYNAIRKYGFDAFDWEIIATCDSDDALCAKEIELIEQYNAIKDGYNTSLGGEGGDNFTNNPHKEEIRQKISKSHIGKKMSEEFKVQNRLRQIGRVISPETRKKRSDSLKGRVITPEHRKKLSDAMTGRKMSEETKTKISKALTGRKLAETTKNKIGEANSKRKHSADTKRKIGEASSKRRASEETKVKMSLARKGKKFSPEHIAHLAEANRKRAIKSKLGINGDIVDFQ